MAKLTQLPALAVIKTYKGVLDFYVMWGIPCVRSWPKPPPALRSPAVQQTSQVFKSLSQLTSTMVGPVRANATLLSKGNPVTWRDIFMRAEYDTLIEIEE